MDSGSGLKARRETGRSIACGNEQDSECLLRSVISLRETAIETRGQHAEQDIASKHALDKENRKWV
jgi:hypothetical protein